MKHLDLISLILEKKMNKAFTDCKLSISGHKIRNLYVLSCEFNTPRIKKDIISQVGEIINFNDKDYTIYGIETYAIPNDCDIYGCSILIDYE